MFGFRRRMRHAKQHHNCQRATLNDVPENETAIILCNQHLKTVELGIHPGAEVMVLRNEEGEPNLVIAVGNARYILDRRVANRIKTAKAATV